MYATFTLNLFHFIYIRRLSPLSLLLILSELHLGLKPNRHESQKLRKNQPKIYQKWKNKLKRSSIKQLLSLFHLDRRQKPRHLHHLSQQLSKNLLVREVRQYPTQRQTVRSQKELRLSYDSVKNFPRRPLFWKHQLR